MVVWNSTFNRKIYPQFSCVCLQCTVFRLCCNINKNKERKKDWEPPSGPELFYVAEEKLNFANTKTAKCNKERSKKNLAAPARTLRTSAIKEVLYRQDMCRPWAAGNQEITRKEEKKEPEERRAKQTNNGMQIYNTAIKTNARVYVYKKVQVDFREQKLEIDS